MKKFGFTLAEVLITLTIIGVVAMMTLPALMTNVGEQQAKTGVKKGLNTLTEAAHMSNAIAGFDYSSFNNTDTAAGSQSIFGMFQDRIQTDMSRSTVQFQVDNNEPPADSRTAAAKRVLTGGTGDLTSYAVMFFRDGSALAFVPGNTSAPSLEYTGIGKGFVGYYDINGEKSPNILSNCSGTKNSHIPNTPLSTTITNNTVATTACDTVANRVIKDQFTFFFSGAAVYPADPATKWAYDN